ncbi:endoglucanase [Plakobranchus ocellatus]|uniref:Endoglucanase n=1 Tax=Plakobranchus ocellatus TaxID=259542 RepID=A0AAV4DYL6_9GAST|nr:endoglucanase [Plakobranchus ocellatus]
MKSVGGLARGRGMGDSQRTQWLLSRPACADINSAMQEVTGSENTTSGQHAESSQSRMRRGDEDMRSLLNFLLSRDPFACDETLRSISTGVTATR